jgi:hypothetical protein
MWRRSKLLALLVLLGGLTVVVGVVVYLVKLEPEFYVATLNAQAWDGDLAKSARLVNRAQELKNEIRSAPEWGAEFTAAELNCFFADNLGPKGGLSSLLPEKTHDPRIAIEGDRLKLGFRYGRGFWSTVIWVELRIWLVAEESNLVGVEVCDLRAGRIPLAAQSILDSITESAHESNVDVTWYRNGPNPVGLFRFFADQPRVTAQILTVVLADGKVVVAGRTSLDQPAAATPP